MSRRSTRQRQPLVIREQSQVPRVEASQDEASQDEGEDAYGNLEHTNKKLSAVVTIPAPSTKGFQAKNA